MNYSDATPDISYTLDRIGRAVTVTDGIGTWTNVYADDGSLVSGTLPQLPGHSMQYAQDSLGRMTNVSILDSASSIVHHVSYGFGNAGRLSSVTDGSHTGIYTYASDGMTWTNLHLGALTTKRTFDGLNRLSSISSVPSASSVVSFSYSLNQADQRTTNTLADGSYWVYTYGSEGQVITGKRYFADGIAVGGCQFEYGTDQACNRTSAEMGDPALAVTQTANDLNQITSATVPGKILFTGTASNNATVSVAFTNGQARLANRHGEYFWKVLDATNTSSLVAATNIIRAVMTQGTQSLVRAEARTSIVAQTPDQFAWDADGNLVATGLWTNQWNGNNQLATMESAPQVPADLKRRLEFKYDYQGRRTEKKVLSGYSAGSYATTSTTTFVWDGMSLITEVRGGTTNFFTYGLDLSGTLGGAGTIGGLVMLSLNGTNCFPAFDGNGNVMGLVYADSGNVAAEYNYGPFGEPLTATGPLAKANPIRWSTKPVDDETGVSSFQARPYWAMYAIFLTRDPIEEEGGPFLYAICAGDTINRVDLLGFEWHIWRRGQARAHVTGETGDTVSELASIIHMDPEQYERWLAVRDEGKLPASADASLCENRRFFIPNVIYFSVGPEWTKWQEKAFPKEPSTQFAMELEPWRSTFESEGFKVIRLDSPPQVWRSEYAYAWVFNGHGEITSGISWWAKYSGEILAVDARYRPIPGALHHKFAWVWIISCHSADEPWENLVAPSGVAKMYSGNVRGIPTPDVEKKGVGSAK